VLSTQRSPSLRLHLPDNTPTVRGHQTATYEFVLTVSDGAHSATASIRLSAYVDVRG
jgi:hypothetical protein